MHPGPAKSPASDPESSSTSAHFRPSLNVIAHSFCHIKSFVFASEETIQDTLYSRSFKLCLLLHVFFHLLPLSLALNSLEQEQGKALLLICCLNTSHKSSSQDGVAAALQNIQHTHCRSCGSVTQATSSTRQCHTLQPGKKANLLVGGQSKINAQSVKGVSTKNAIQPRLDQQCCNGWGKWGLY